jgi:multidrug resistance efflux pump
MTPNLKIVLAALAVALAPAAAAETLYKLIDKNGKVTYSESKPKTFDGQVIRIDIDPNANTATLEKPQAKSTGEGTVNRQRGEAKSPAKIDEEARIAQARERLAQAQKALQDAKDNPGEGDLMMVGKVGGGVRTIPSEAYQQRLERLEAEVRSAEEDLRRAEQGR